MRAFILMLATAAGTAGCTPSAPPGCPTCARARLANEWCDACKVGYVAGVPIQCKVVFECIDAHGHKLMLRTIECPSCKAAIAINGFCETCRIGWLDGLAYYSRLTYHLAKGKACDPATLGCAACRGNASRYGWCAACGVGMIGNVAIRDRKDFDDGCRGYDLMITAVEASRRCDVCGLAIMTDTSCFRCRKTYKDGKEVGS